MCNNCKKLINMLIKSKKYIKAKSISDIPEITAILINIDRLEKLLKGE